jgi:hypothetical protein
MNRLLQTTILLCSIALFALCSLPSHGADLKGNFVSPPGSARPWVYWFWLNGNITRIGIKDDLEAMKRVGIGGVLIMEVDQGTPAGPVAFGSPEWRSLFHYVCAEAHSLGLEINMSNDAGWCGSGGPWITPALSMKRVVWAESHFSGGRIVKQDLPQPETVDNYYEDIDVIAFPTPVDDSYRISDINGKSAHDAEQLPPAPATYPALPPSQVIPADQIVHLDGQFVNGILNWNAPLGNWTVLRIGYTTTGVENHPAPQAGLGLECDKLSKIGSDAQFKGLMAKLIADNPGPAGSSLVSTHIDSWEIGDQNWSPTFRQDFVRLRGYDPDDYLPVMTGRVVGSLEVSERFLWDIRLTVSQLLDENYAGNMETLAKQHGIRLSIEGYDGSPTDDIAYAGRADEPMSEFWATGQAGYTTDEMSSAAHTYGKRILGAESFTSDSSERWLYSPAALKAEGDWALSDGVNRFVFHRYAMQPWADVKPGMSMGPWGLHYERTETWWEQSKAWHEYLARCQYLLRQGLFVADICYLQPEGAPRRFSAPVPGQGDLYSTRPGYNFDGCSSDVVMHRMSVKNGLIVLPDGMSYRVLALPDVQTMTPELLAKIADLIKEGATVVGPRPIISPSLSGYPNCDSQIQDITKQLWGDYDGSTAYFNKYGKGRIISGVSAEQALVSMNVPEDLTCGSRPYFRYTHRRTSDGEDIYFVANKSGEDRTCNCVFRAAGKSPEFWWPESGKTELAAIYTAGTSTTTIPITLQGTESVFVIFKPGAPPRPHFNSITYARVTGNKEASELKVLRASYGPLGDASRTEDVREKLQQIADNGERSFRVAQLAEGYDPAFGVVKTLIADYVSGDHTYHIQGVDTDTITFAQPWGSSIPFTVTSSNGAIVIHAWRPGRYTLASPTGKPIKINVPAVPKALTVDGPWSLSFPPNLGAPPHVDMHKLISWSDSDISGVRYFSGTAAYETKFNAPSELTGKSVLLDLGQVDEIAEVSLNGKNLGTFWHPPYRVDVTGWVRQGANNLQIKVTNLWVNRMIGDQQLPPDSDRNSDGTLKSWPAWLEAGQPNPTGRFTFTTWQLWGKNDPLQPSGLLGPVTLSFSKDITIPR